MSVQRIQRGKVLCGRVLVAVDGITIKRPADWFPWSRLLFEMDGCDVIVIVVRATAVATELIQFTSQQRVSPAIILDGIEDRHAIDSNRDGTTKEIRFC